MPGRKRPSKQKQKKQKQRPKPVPHVVPVVPRPPPVVHRSIGDNIADVVGGGAKWLFNKITGFGDYTIRRNTLLGPGNQPVMFSNSDKFEVRKREMCFDLSATTTFSNNKYDITPSNTVLFPWLSLIASGFQQYRFRGLVFHYKATSSDALNSTNTTLCEVMMATNYDCAQPAYNDKVGLLNSYWSNNSKSSLDFFHGIECDPRANVLANGLLTGVPPVGADKHLYHLGCLNVATDQAQNTNKVGEIWVTYDAEFQKPITGNGAYTSIVHFTASAGIDNTNWFGTNATLVSGGLKVTISNTTLTFNETGTFLVIYARQGNATATWTALTPSFGAGAAAYNTMFATSKPNIPIATQTSTGGTLSSINCLSGVTISAVGATMTYAAGTGPTSSGNMDVIVVKLFTGYSFASTDRISELQKQIDRLSSLMNICSEEEEDYKEEPLSQSVIDLAKSIKAAHIK
jgi:hypothetical protein